MKRVLMIGLVFVLFVTLSGSQGKTIVVDDDVGSWTDYGSIQEAIDNSEADDEIRVYDGWFFEAVNINQSINLIGNGTETLITSDYHSIVKVNADGVLLENLTIGNTTNNSNGVWVNRTNLTIRQCYFKSIYVGVRFSIYHGNSTILECHFNDIRGSGIYYEDYSHIPEPTTRYISDCRFENVNTGIHLNYANARINRCEYNNISGYGIWSCGTRTIIEECNFTGDGGYNGAGIYLYYRYSEIRDCSLSRFRSAIYLEQYRLINEPMSKGVISNTSFFDNHLGIYNEVSYNLDIYSCLFYYNNRAISGNPLIYRHRLWNSTFIENGGRFQVHRDDEGNVRG